MVIITSSIPTSFHLHTRVKYTTLDWSDLGETYEKEGKNYVPMCSPSNFTIHPGIDISPLKIHKSAFLPNWFSRI